MVYTFDTCDEYLEELIRSASREPWGDPGSVVFDLNASMDLSEIALSVYECTECESIDVLYQGDSVPWACHQCGRNRVLMASVTMVVQGDSVLYRRPQ